MGQDENDNREPETPQCAASEHSSPPLPRLRPEASGEALERAAAMFQAMGDRARLRLLDLLSGEERCVSDLATATQAGMSTVSQQLRHLHEENLVTRQRVGKHVFYGLADRHVRDLLENVLAHAARADCAEGEAAAAAPEAMDAEAARLREIERTAGNMTTSSNTCKQHENHSHQHGANCGHTAIEHNGHVDYLHDGHLHHPHEDHVDEHTLEVNGTNPANCTPAHNCGAHPKDHVHGPGCGHEAIPHGDHVDYLVDGHLHHPHGDHCDDHGPVTIATGR